MTLIGTAVLPVMVTHISAGPSGSGIVILGVSKLNVGSSLCVLVWRGMERELNLVCVLTYNYNKPEITN